MALKLSSPCSALPSCSNSLCCYSPLASLRTSQRAAYTSFVEPLKVRRKESVVIVGGGPAGCLLTHYLVKRGFYVHLFERYPGFSSGGAKSDKNEQVYVKNDQRSYTMLLSPRAIRALEGADVELPVSLLRQLVGSCVHASTGEERIFDYSNGPGVHSYGVSRNAFVSFLQNLLLERYPERISTHFGWELININDSEDTATFQNVSKYKKGDCDNRKDVKEVNFDLLVGADGVSSKVRAEMLRLNNSSNVNNVKSPPLKMDFTANPEFYKSFYVRPSLAKTSPLFIHHNRVQSWPALNMLLVGMADGSFWGGTKNPKLLNASSAADVEKLFRQNAPELYELLLQENLDFAEDFLKLPSISFGGAVILSRFHHDNILLLGDAAHAMFPSYGTGCNAALEDCFLFDKILGQLMDSVLGATGKVLFSNAASEFTKQRLADAHAIVEMNTSRILFPSGQWGFLQSALLTTLHKMFPKLIRPTSYQLLWSQVGYQEIKRQKRMEDIFFYGFMSVICILLALLTYSLIKPRWSLFISSRA